MKTAHTITVIIAALSIAVPAPLSAAPRSKEMAESPAGRHQVDKSSKATKPEKPQHPTRPASKRF